ncbi:hypothetical protein C7E25_25270, partial [Stenotrophomonas maltophilia]
EIRFDDVVFHYPQRPDQAALDHFNLHVRPGRDRSAGEIRFDDVVFHYPQRPDQAALDHFNLHVRPGRDR